MAGISRFTRPQVQAGSVHRKAHQTKNLMQKQASSDVPHAETASGGLNSENILEF
jgi:hypothetical protein